MSLELVALITGCATTSLSEREALLSREIDCTHAEEDVAQLENVLPTRRERAESAVQSVTPIGIVTGATSGSYKDRFNVFNGSSTAELQARIDDIEEKCGVNSNEKE